MNVLVYAGPGTTTESIKQTTTCLRLALSPYYAIHTVNNPSLFSTQPWEAYTAMVVIPGGADLPVCANLNGTGNQRIRKFVERGGRYWGICSGAYYGSQLVEFEKGDKTMEVYGKRELAFFNGVARGTAFKKYVYNSEAGARAANVVVNTQAFCSEDQSPNLTQDGEPLPVVDFKSYYNGGGIFDPYDLNEIQSGKIEILAQYGDRIEVEGPNNAVVLCKVNNGKALLMGIHPEFSPQFMKRVTKVTENSSAEDIKYNEIIQDLVPHDSHRFDFVRACLNKLGLRVGPKAEMTIPHLTRMKLSSTNIGDIERLMANLRGSSLETSAEGNAFLLSCQSNDFVFQASGQNIVNPTTLIETEAKTEDDDEEEGKKIRLTVEVFDQGTNHIPDARSTPHFNHYLYYSTLQRLHATNPATKFSAAPKYGASVLYSEVITSTSTIMESNPLFLQALPDGFAVTGTIQNQGRGRGGNVWVNPVGVLAVSYVYRMPFNIDTPAFVPRGVDGFNKNTSYGGFGGGGIGNSIYGGPSFAQPTNPLVFVQYIASLAMVEAIRDLSGKGQSGYQNLPVLLKWPNDIYALDPNLMTADDISGKKDKLNMAPADYLKIGGLLVNCSPFNGDYYFVIGCGVNVANDKSPTTSLNLLVDKYNQLKPAGAPELDHYTMEELMATFMNKFEQISYDFNYQGFTPFEEQYYSRWLHSNQIVRVEQAGNTRCKIIGLADDGGLQVQELDTPSKSKINLVPDGNSFDMLKGLLKRKI